MEKFKTTAKTALVFFSIGTLFLFTHLLFRGSLRLILAGYLYVIASVFINGLIVSVLLYTLIMESNKKETLKSIGILLLNAPIAYSYFLIAINKF